MIEYGRSDRKGARLGWHGVEQAGDVRRRREVEKAKQDQHDPGPAQKSAGESLSRPLGSPPRRRKSITLAAGEG